MLLLTPMAGADGLLSDDFDTTNTGMNDDLASRQSGSLATVTWSKSANANASISGNSLHWSTGNNNAGPIVSPDHDFSDAASIAGGGFTISFDVVPNASQFTGLSLGTSSSGDRLNDGGNLFTYSTTDYGFLIRPTGAGTVFIGGAGHNFSTTAASSYNVQLEVLTTGFSAGTAATATLTINGVAVDSNRAFTWDSEGQNYIAFSMWRSAGDTSIDNLSISAIPEPSSGMLLIAAVAGLPLIRRRTR